MRGSRRLMQDRVLALAGRNLVAPMFVINGTETFRHPEHPVGMARDFLDQWAGRIGLPLQDWTAIVRANAVLHVVAGACLAAGWHRREAALTLAASLLPTTLAAHSFWNVDGPGRREEQIAFLANTAAMGALLSIAASES